MTARTLPISARTSGSPGGSSKSVPVTRAAESVPGVPGVGTGDRIERTQHDEVRASLRPRQGVSEARQRRHDRLLQRATGEMGRGDHPHGVGAPAPPRRARPRPERGSPRRSLGPPNGLDEGAEVLNSVFFVRARPGPRGTADRRRPSPGLRDGWRFNHEAVLWSGSGIQGERESRRVVACLLPSTLALSALDAVRAGTGVPAVPGDGLDGGPGTAGVSQPVGCRSPVRSATRFTRAPAARDTCLHQLLLVRLPERTDVDCSTHRRSGTTFTSANVFPASSTNLDLTFIGSSPATNRRHVAHRRSDGLFVFGAATNVGRNLYDPRERRRLVRLQGETVSPLLATS